MASTIKSVAVLGLGAMGHAFASNLLEKNFQVAGWNRDSEKGKDLLKSGLEFAESPQQAVARAEVTLAMLADGQVTLQVIQQAINHFPRDAIVVQMGTIGLHATEQLRQLVTEQRPDIHFVDAPVSGTKKPAEEAKITIFASGDDQLASKLAPVFAAISKASHWLGEAGTGSAMKLVVNSYLLGIMQSLAESQRLAAKLGFSPEQLWSVLEGGPLATPYAKTKLEMISQGDFTPQMQLKWAQKDAKLALDAGDRQQLPGLEQIVLLWQQAIDAGYGEQDLAVITDYLSKR